MSIYKSSPLKVYTTTICCYLGTEINLDHFFEITKLHLDKNGIISIKYNDYHIYIPHILKKKKKSKIFFNQCTIIVESISEKYANVKLFTNGNIQMTGCKNILETNYAINNIIRYLKKKIILFNEKKILNIVKDETKLGIHNLRMPFINTGFKFNFKIERRALHILLIQKYNMFTKYDTNIHVGVRTRFISYKGNVVHITIFQTGSALIASCDLDCIDEGYDLINDICINNFETIHKKTNKIKISNVKKIKKFKYNNNTLLYIVKQAKI